MTRDLLLGGAALALAAGYYAMAAAIPPSLLADEVGPEGLPQTYAVLLAGLALILIVRSLGRARATSRRGIDWQQGRQLLQRVAGLLAIGALYVALVPWLGYAAAIAGLILATAWYQGGVLNREVAVVAMSGALIFWLLFVVLLRIPQPAGLWPSLL